MICIVAVWNGGLVDLCQFDLLFVINVSEILLSLAMVLPFMVTVDILTLLGVGGLRC